MELLYQKMLLNDTQDFFYHSDQWASRETAEAFWIREKKNKGKKRKKKDLSGNI